MDRREIHYWKCDRPAAFHGTAVRGEADPLMEQRLLEAMRDHFRTQEVMLAAGSGQGNHLTWNATVGGVRMFLRIENGPENDNHLTVESALLDRVRAVGVPTPQVHGCDASRTRVPFAWQALERIDAPDLNHWFKQGVLAAETLAFEIGAAVARWQGVTLEGFGVLDDQLRGYRVSYPDYFQLRLEEHLAFLLQRGFLTSQQSQAMLREIEHHGSLLRINQGCLVHKDLALWNILGTRDRIAAFIDFDDAISGDPMDDLSLLACFHEAAFVRAAFEGYQTMRPLPEEHLRRFWLHLLRNMIVKAVIRVGAGYFDRTDSFFLIGAGGGGSALRQFTLDRLDLALRGLASGAEIEGL